MKGATGQYGPEPLISGYLNIAYSFLLLNCVLFMAKSYLVAALMTLFCNTLLVRRVNRNSYCALLFRHLVVWLVDNKDSEENFSPFQGKSELR